MPELHVGFFDNGHPAIRSKLLKISGALRSWLSLGWLTGVDLHAGDVVIDPSMTADNCLPTLNCCRTPYTCKFKGVRPPTILRSQLPDLLRNSPVVECRRPRDTSEGHAAGGAGTSLVQLPSKASLVMILV